MAVGAHHQQINNLFLLILMQSLVRLTGHYRGTGIKTGQR